MRIAAQLFLVRKNCVVGGVGLREALDHGAHLRERLYGGEPGAGFDSGIGRGHAHAIPFFFQRILWRKEQQLAGSIPRFIAWFGLRENDKACAFFIVAGEVVEVFFLLEDIGLRGLLTSGEAPENDGGVGLSRELGTALKVDAIGLAVAALLCRGRGRGAPGAEASQN